MNEIISIIAYRNPDHFLYVTLLLVASAALIYRLGGRVSAFLYVLIIPFINWSFGIIPEFQIFEPGEVNRQGISLHPLTIVTGLVLVLRDFVQREIQHRVLILMVLATAWSFYYSWPVIALASGIAFAISEIIDWALFTFTKYRLSTRILLSSAVAAPVDTTVFLYGADLAQRIELGLEPGNTFHLANWIVFITGKMLGAIVVSRLVRRREQQAALSEQTA